MKINHLLAIAFILISTLPSTSQQLPIKPTRTISFTTTEGTAMDVDISPDGKTIIFDLLGDLYSVPIKGGNATQLTRGIAINLRPVWSPDGKKIAYISDYSGAFRLMVRDMQGTFQHVLGESNDIIDYSTPSMWKSPVWTPDGNYIAINQTYFSTVGGKMFSQENIGRPLRYSKDGRLGYYLDSGHLYSYDYQKNTRTIISPKLRSFYNGAISPDGRWWAYIADSNSQKCLIVQDLEDNNRRILVSSFTARHPLSPNSVKLRYTFSPDSKTILIAYGGKIHRIDVASGMDQIIPFIAKVKADLGPFDYNLFHVSHDSLKIQYTRSANASPDGKHLVFSALNKLYTMEMPNGIAHILAEQSVSQFQPAYSPDGKWIAYVSWCDTAGGRLWRIPADGGKPEQMTHLPGLYQRPAWSPDGKLIAIVKAPPILTKFDLPGVGELEIIPVNGGDTRIIDDSVPLWNRLAFSSDGSRILYEPMPRQKEEGPLLVSKSLDGKDSLVLASGWPLGGESSALILNRTISPDNRFIAYSLGEDLYLVPVCKLSQPTVLYDPKQGLPLIRFAQGVDPYWEEGGKKLSWSYGNKFYRINTDKIISAAQKRLMFTPINDTIIKVSVPADEVTKMNVTVPRFYAHGTIALQNVRILTMKGNKVIEDGTIVIQDGRFIAIGPKKQTPVPTNAKRLDLSGTTVMPGLVDLHLHMHLPQDVFPQQTWMYLANLAYGVTTARDPSSNFDSFGYKELLESGQMIGPRLYTVGYVVILFSNGITGIDNMADARSVVNKRALFGATTIKQYTLPNRIQRQWLLIASREAGLDMTNEGAYNPLLDIAMIKDGSTGVEHSPDWGDVYNDMIQFIAKSGCYFTPTLLARFNNGLVRNYFNYIYWHQTDPKMNRFLPSAESQDIVNENAKDTANTEFWYPALISAQIRHSGGNVPLGSHGDNEGTGVHNELWALQMGGLSNMEALQAATIMGAKGLGMQKDLGSIEVGKIADLIILNKNPLDDIHNSREIRFVMKDGVLYDAETLDEVWPEVKKCPDWRLKLK